MRPIQPPSDFNALSRGIGGDDWDRLTARSSQDGNQYCHESGVDPLLRDWPYNGAPLRSNSNDGQLDYQYLRYNFELDVCAQPTQSPRDNAASKLYIKEATANWSFNGDGGVNNLNGFVWTSNGAIVTPPPNNAWSAPITTGAMPKVDGTVFNDALERSEGFVAVNPNALPVR